MDVGKLRISIAIAVVATLPAVYLRFADYRPDPVLDAALFGVAILSAGFMLSWGAESARNQRIPADSVASTNRQRSPLRYGGGPVRAVRAGCCRNDYDDFRQNQSVDASRWACRHWQ